MEHQRLGVFSNLPKGPQLPKCSEPTLPPALLLLPRHAPSSQAPLPQVKNAAWFSPPSSISHYKINAPKPFPQQDLPQLWIFGKMISHHNHDIKDHTHLLPYSLPKSSRIPLLLKQMFGKGREERREEMRRRWERSEEGKKGIFSHYHSSQPYICF